MPGLTVSFGNFTTFHLVFHNFSFELFHAYCCTIYCSQLWVNFSKSTYLKLKVAYNNMHRQILGYNSWDSASCMFVSNSIDNFDTQLHKNGYGFRKRFMTLKLI